MLETKQPAVEAVLGIAFLRFGNTERLRVLATFCRSCFGLRDSDFEFLRYPVVGSRFDIAPEHQLPLSS